MTFTGTDLKKLQNFYGEWTLDFVIKWADHAIRAGKPEPYERWINSAGDPVSTPVNLNPDRAVLVLRPEPRRIKVRQVVYTPTTDKVRHLRLGEYYMTGGVAYQFLRGLDRPSPTIPYKCTVAEVEVEEEEI